MVVKLALLVFLKSEVLHYDGTINLCRFLAFLLLLFMSLWHMCERENTGRLKKKPHGEVRDRDKLMQKIWKELQEVPTYRQARHELAEGQCPNGGGPVVKRHKKKKM